MKIRAIALQTAGVAQGPRTVRLLINRPSVSFEDAEEPQAVVQEFELSEEDVREGRRLPLRFVRFQSITSLHVSACHSALLGGLAAVAHACGLMFDARAQIFVVSNQGGEDETRIDAIDIFGMPVM